MSKEHNTEVEEILNICGVQHEDTDRKKCLKHYKWSNTCDCEHDEIKKELTTLLQSHTKAVEERVRKQCVIED
mgnify:CR=1 FL=1